MFLRDFGEISLLPCRRRTIDDISQSNLHRDRHSIGNAPAKHVVKGEFTFTQQRFPRKIGECPATRTAEENQREDREQYDAGDEQPGLNIIHLGMIGIRLIERPFNFKVHLISEQRFAVRTLRETRKST